jgi:pyruvate,water dikinase
MAVVVQAMVQAKWAGVMFTADPVSGRHDQIVVEAVPGLGESLVSGNSDGKRFVIEKTTMRVLSRKFSLPDEVVKQLPQLGVQIEQVFGLTGVVLSRRFLSR